MTTQQRTELAKDLEDWAERATEMIEHDMRVPFLEHAERVLGNMGIMLEGQELCHTPNGGGSHSFWAIEQGRVIGNVFLGWTRSLGGYVYDAVVSV